MLVLSIFLYKDSSAVISYLFNHLASHKDEMLHLLKEKDWKCGDKFRGENGKIT